jgi:hypothetical protein
MNTLKSALIASILMTATMAAADAAASCSDEFLDIQFTFMKAMNEDRFATDYERAAQELNEPVAQRGIEGRQKANALFAEVKTRARAFVENKECDPADRATIKRKYL